MHYTNHCNCHSHLHFKSTAAVLYRCYYWHWISASFCIVLLKFIQLFGYPAASV